MVVVVGGGAVLGAFEVWDQGRWGLFAVLVLVALVCVLAVAPRVLLEAWAHLLLVAVALSWLLRLFPRTRAWGQRMREAVR
ncbi:hypothetical protein [Nocardia lasii]|uniref:DUF4175 domain-containing protein n=1 Tax=Nocardia lasii TaxID=1616107 RepID=A0ABW1JL13_9NOCA